MKYEKFVNDGTETDFRASLREFESNESNELNSQCLHKIYCKINTFSISIDYIEL